ncbi:acetylornithine deacetylase/succinyldiaminopimelate desuccinylase-like deacylase [Sphaerochaeta pleomorpha str. Grapes]|uniref:Acetylornithine deacetylase/succinyldiaminopimelate desuccinylase-like deacylase n=1 Tax=Sphaerochaeta pleomorpha (strain ATCC BAA-1885 / DSM 22778 / Grapes) TaxID=158190 RepID=G8QRG8_SPHPG|nr:M20/M25/M40 family metallo-hydrolase [Sphaerochaeta pleomorpha]AEV29890.1 acetylornithine deacetylase/succinyldiaminopimelate desuccinylase-like deacylase [Sphaerochaeta pleomorpha str. Grapes]
MVLLSILIVLLFPVTIATVRTLILQNTDKKRIVGTRIEENKEAITKLQAAITFKTVSNLDTNLVDWNEFERFHEYLKQAFPLATQTLQIPSDSPHNLIYCLPGTNVEAEPALLTAHQDVVSAQPSQWKHDPFKGDEAEGFIWGRGSFDCKLQLIAILQAFEEMVSSGIKPQRTWYAAFGCDEEVNGGEAGATLIARQFERMGLTFSLIMDEGGAVAERYIGGINRPIAVVGVAEKGYLDAELSCCQEAGHSSTPTFPTALGKISEALVKIERTKHKATFTQPVIKMLENIGKEAPFPFAFLFLNLWLTKPILKATFAKNPTLNAIIRTTSVPTVIQASDKNNVIALQATAVVNSRLLSSDDEKSTVKWIQDTVKDKNITVKVMRYDKPSKESPVEGKAYEAVKVSIKKCFPDAIVSSYLMLGATDARKYQNLAKYIYRFTPAQMDKSEISRMHGPDERMSKENISAAVSFFKVLMKNW